MPSEIELAIFYKPETFLATSQKFFIANEKFMIKSFFKEPVKNKRDKISVVTPSTADDTCRLNPA